VLATRVADTPIKEGRFAQCLEGPDFPTQVIVYTEYPDRAAGVEDQVTYPLTTALLAVPRSKVVGASRSWRSFVYVVFEDGHGWLLGA